MENTNNTNQQRANEHSDDSLEGVSPQRANSPLNEDEQDNVVYAGLGVNNDPDIMNPGDKEATDTVLHTDTITARHATDGVPNADDLREEDLSDDDLDQQIIELADEEQEGNERY